MTSRMAIVGAILLALGGCAGEEGAAARGDLSVVIHPAGEATAGVRLDRATLVIGGVVPHGPIAAEDGDDHGHAHAHLDAPHESAAAARFHEHAHDEDAEADDSTLLPAPVAIDLLGGERIVAALEVAAGHYEGLDLLLAEDAGCALRLEGDATLGAEAVEVIACLPAGDGIHVEAPFDVAYRGETALELHLHVEALLRGFDLEAAERDQQGRVHLAGDAAIHARLRANLADALQAP